MLRQTVLATLMTVSLPSFAGNFDFMAGQKDLQKIMESGDYRSALKNWDASTRGTAFKESQTGLATWAYLLHQNGMPYTALETLFRSTQPKNIDSKLLKLWSTELLNSPIAQKGWVQSQGGWKTIVNNDPAPAIALKSKADVAKAFRRANAVKGANAKARVLWQIATRAPLIGEIDSSLRALKLMRESGQTVISQDEIFMTQGRVLYQKGDLLAALNAYEQVPKSSNLWVDAVEERAWVHLRRDDYDQAWGTVTTAMSPVLAPLAGPETFFLANLMAFKACDYSRVFNNSETFKKRHHERLVSIQELADKGTNAHLTEAMNRFEKDGVNPESAGNLVQFIPRHLIRDGYFTRNMESRRQILKEVAQAQELGLTDARTLQTLNLEKTRSEKMKEYSLQRVRTLAQTDVKEYKVVLNKMHIIEGEIIERLHLDDNLKGERSKLTQVEDTGDVLVFPVSDEVWMDELDNYKARVKDCPTLKKAAL